MSSTSTKRRARVIIPADEFLQRRIQRDEARSGRAFLGAAEANPTPHIDNAACERTAEVLKFVRRRRARRASPERTPRRSPNPAPRWDLWLRWTPGLPPTHTLEDPLSDAAGCLIVAMNAFSTWTRKKRDIYERLLQQLKKEGYYFFEGSLRAHPLSRIGASVVYKVPGNKNGHLKRFRNKTIRLIRIGSSSGYATAQFAAQEFLALERQDTGGEEVKERGEAREQAASERSGQEPKVPSI